jgi:hypothetical protein
MTGLLKKRVDTLIVSICTFIIVGISACNIRTDIPSIKLDLDRSIHYSPNITIEAVINLEANDISLIGEVDRIEIFDSLIFILDRFQSSAVLIFDKNGKFLTRTSNGRGPSEMISPWDFYIDKNKRQIIIYDQNTFRLMSYDFNLNLIKSSSHQGLPIRNFIYIGEDTVFAFTQSPIIGEIREDIEPVHYNYLVFTNELSTVIDKLFKYPREFTPFTCASPISHSSGLKFLVPFDYSIYSYDNGQVKQEYKINPGSFGFSPSELEKGASYIMDKIRNKEKISFLDQLHESEEYLSFNFWYKDDTNTCIYDKNKHEAFLTKSLVESSLIPRGIVIGISQNSFFYLVQPEDLISYYTSHPTKDIISQRINANDNPYILKFSIN